MTLSFEAFAPWIVLVAVLLVSGALAAARWGHRGRPPTETAASDLDTHVPVESENPADERANLRSYALDALGEAVLITDSYGQIRDCNSSALTLFDRHRAAVQEHHVSSLRQFEGLGQGDPHRVAAERAVWLGEAWARQPDGGMRLCVVRVIAIRDGSGEVTGFVESFRDATADPAMGEEFRDLLYGVRAFHSGSASNDENVRAVREELRLLTEAFRDLDLVLRQYERLLPSLSADDPLAETIAGVASDARAAVAAVGVSSLLEQIPRSLARLRGHLQKLVSATGVAGSGGADGDGGGDGADAKKPLYRPSETERSATSELKQVTP